MHNKITGERLIAASEALLILYQCLPITISLLNSFLIRGLVLVAAVLFISGLLLLNKWRYLFEFVSLFLLTLLFWNTVWRQTSDSSSYVYYCFASLSFAFGGAVIYQHARHYTVRRLFLLLTAVYLITAITSTIGLRIYPLAAREMARGSTYDTSLDFETYKTIYRRMNIAGWGQIYGMLFVIPCCLLLWKRKRNALYLILLAFVELAIVFSQITFAVILSVLFICAFYLIGRENSFKAVLIVFFAAIVFAVVLLNLNGVLTFAIDLSDKIGFSFLTDKLGDLRQLLVNNQVIGDASSRGELYAASLRSFTQSPLYGLIFDSNVTPDKIGRHSELFDLLGALGMIGAAGILYSVVSYIRFIWSTGKGCRKELLIIFFGFLALFMLNPVFNSPPIFVGAFLYPVLCVKMCLVKDTEPECIKKLLDILGGKDSVGVQQ